MTRAATLWISTADPTDRVFRDAVTELTERADRLDRSKVDVWLSISTDHEGEPEHPERDALLALADKWRGESEMVAASSADPAYSSTLCICADELVRLVATLGL